MKILVIVEFNAKKIFKDTQRSHPKSPIHNK